MMADAGFGPRYTPNAAVVGDDIALYAGQDWEPVEWCNSRPDCRAHADRSVWKTSDGKTWSKVLDQAPWEGRSLVHGSAVFQNQIFLIGGGLNVGGHNEKQNIEVVKTICEVLEELASSTGNPNLTGVSCESGNATKYPDLIRYVADRPGHDMRYAIDAGKIQRELGWTPQETFESGIRKTVQWYLDNQVWCRHVQDGSYQRERLGSEN